MMFRRFLRSGSSWRCFAAPGFPINRRNLFGISKELENMFAIVLDRPQGNA